MSDLGKHYNFNEVEKKWQKFWQDNKTYAWDKNSSKEDTFIVDTPPPTVSGQLHMGHIFSYTQADFIVRFQRMMGKNIFYPIGFDDNGLPTERLVEKQKKIRAVQTDRAQFIKICEEVVDLEEEKFRTLFNNIALSVDWSCEYQTISARSRTISQMSFLDLVEKGQVYRDNQPILWDPVDQTALAQADVEDKEYPSSMNEIIFTTENGEKLNIATTRPEMLPACVAVFYHPEDKRYRHLQGKQAITPIFGASVPILEDSTVSMEKGTGLVMCCTFGDATDVSWWKTHKLPLKNLINKYGKIAEIEVDLGEAKSALDMIVGKKVAEAREIIIGLLKDKNLLVKQESITHNVKCAERSGAPLEIIPVACWFVKTVEHKDALLKMSQEINWYPSHMKHRLDNWINGVAWDWCISRQRFFGVPFPAWYSKRKGEEGKVLFASKDQLPVDPIKDLPHGYTKEEVEPDFDVMDTWATSSVSPQLSSHGISENFAVDLERHKALFPADLRPQAHEIIRTWAFYTMLKSHLHENQAPWKNIMISGWCLAEDKSKMSKSKGNIIEPQNLIDNYGSDVVRYWASTSRLGADTAYSEDIIKDGKRLVNKLWNAAKFASQHFDKVSDYGSDISENVANKKISVSTDLWIISKLHNVVKKATENFKVFEYAIAMETVQEFFWKDFCDNYLEIVKVRSYNENTLDASGQESAVITLYWVLNTLLHLFAPILPHITEELHNAIFGAKKSIHARSNWPDYNKISYNQDALDSGKYMIEVIDIVRKVKAERNLSIKSPLGKLNIDSPVSIDEKMLSDIMNVTATDRDYLGELDEILISNEKLKVTLGFPRQEI
ncbi:MAG UNVERIFIED_CONTAM: valine--tRNA ligase [Rickettsiaceae bacterium]|jgi:valyl-tRNA synthetase